MIHYSPLKKRRREMTDMLRQHGVRVDRWIVEFDRDNLTDAMKSCFHPASWDLLSPSSTSPRKLKRHPLGKPIASRLRPTQISVVTKHYFALYLAAHEAGPSLILEDDVLLRNGFRKHLQTLHRELAKQRGLAFDVVMVGGCLKMYAQRKRYAAKKLTDHLYEKQEARCAHAYVVSPRGAQRILNSMPLTLPIDFQLSTAFKEEDLTVLWVEPWLAVQGDIDGGCVTEEFYRVAGPKRCPTMFLRPFPPAFNLSFLEKTRSDF